MALGARSHRWRRSICPLRLRFPRSPRLGIFVPLANIGRIRFPRPPLAGKSPAFRDERGRVAVLDALLLPSRRQSGTWKRRSMLLPARITIGLRPNGTMRVDPRADRPPHGFACGPIRPSSGHGYVFFFNGPESDFPLPFFDNCDPARVRRQPGVSFHDRQPVVHAGRQRIRHAAFSRGSDRKLLGTSARRLARPLLRGECDSTRK